MKQLLKLVKGLALGEFKLEEYTRSNQENSDKSITMNFGFKVTKKPR